MDPIRPLRWIHSIQPSTELDQVRFLAARFLVISDDPLTISPRFIGSLARLLKEEIAWRMGDTVRPLHALKLSHAHICDALQDDQ